MAEIYDQDGDVLTVESEFGSLWLSTSSSLGAVLNPEMARRLRHEIDLYISATPERFNVGHYENRKRRRAKPPSHDQRADDVETGIPMRHARPDDEWESD